MTFLGVFHDQLITKKALQKWKKRKNRMVNKVLRCQNIQTPIDLHVFYEVIIDRRWIANSIFGNFEVIF